MEREAPPRCTRVFAQRHTPGEGWACGDAPNCDHSMINTAHVCTASQDRMFAPMQTCRCLQASLPARAPASEFPSACSRTNALPLSWFNTPFRTVRCRRWQLPSRAWCARAAGGLCVDMILYPNVHLCRVSCVCLCVCVNGAGFSSVCLCDFQEGKSTRQFRLLRT